MNCIEKQNIFEPSYFNFKLPVEVFFPTDAEIGVFVNCVSHHTMQYLTWFSSHPDIYWLRMFEIEQGMP